jgi:excisionase family DNA binding protein
MQRQFSPGQVARAIGVSESSVKRWCDRGLLRTVRTAGGHRRVPFDEVMRFVRDGGHTLADPSALGLLATRTPTDLDEAVQHLLATLVGESTSEAEAVLALLYAAGHSMALLADRVIAPVFREIGARWRRGELEVYRERRATTQVTAALGHMRAMIVEPADDAPRALGASSNTDHYDLPTALAALSLRDAGWRAQSLGSNLPLASLEDALRAEEPQLCWLSVSHVDDPATFLRDYGALQAAARELGVPIAVGGRMLEAPLREQMRYSAYCDTMTHLVSFAEALRPAA